jgi:hypothetical protein
MLVFETRDGEVIGTMNKSALTTSSDSDGWTVFEGMLVPEQAAAVGIASTSGDLVVLFGEKRLQAFLDSPVTTKLGSAHPVAVTGRFLLATK